MKAYAYTRVSGKGQASRDGPQRQRLAIKRFAAQRGIVICGKCNDVVSGTVAHRIGIGHMLRRSKRADCIIIETIDRLARDVFVLIVLLKRLHRNGLGCLEVATGHDLVKLYFGTPEEKCIVTLRGVMVEADRGQIARRLRSARERKRANGERCEGRKPYGTHPGERDTLDLMCKMRTKRRFSYCTIAAALNTIGRTTRTGRPWTDVHVGRVLRREKL